MFFPEGKMSAPVQFPAPELVVVADQPVHRVAHDEDQLGGVVRLEDPPRHLGWRCILNSRKRCSPPEVLHDKFTN